MKLLGLPAEGARELFQECVDGVDNATLRSNLLSVTDLIEAADTDYRDGGKKAELHLFPATSVIGPGVTANEMSWVYRERLVRKRSRRRRHYDKLLLRAPLGICPLCAQRIVSTLDHYLPLSVYVTVALSPANMVPACLDCNKLKLDHVPHAKSDLTLHPYFDDYSAETWLKATVHQTIPASLTFAPIAPAQWGPMVQSRLEKHFKVFALGALYAANAAVELVNIRESLRLLYNAGGDTAVQTHLLREAASREVADRNTWQTAMYKALSSSQWYCDGGFR